MPYGFFVFHYYIYSTVTPSKLLEVIVELYDCRVISISTSVSPFESNSTNLVPLVYFTSGVPAPEKSLLISLYRPSLEVLSMSSLSLDVKSVIISPAPLGESRVD